MIKSKEDKLKFLRDIKKEEEIHSLLYEILPEIGYEDVTITHERGNRSENGKDLICSTYDNIEDKKDWFAFVVKKGAVAGTSLVIQDIISQTKDCFEYEYKDVVKGLRFRVNKVKIVTNKHFSSEAKAKIEKNNNFDRANISFWDDEKLVQLIDKHNPQFWLKGSKSYKKYVERFFDLSKTETLSKTIGVSDKKIQKILECAIEPKMQERVENEDGTFSWRTKSTNSIVNLEDNSIIIGEPGSGKSTLFKVLSKEIIEQNSLRNEVEFYPISLTFQDLKDNDFLLEKTIVEYFKKDWNSDLLINGQEIINSRDCVVFIDALDELAQKEQKEKALKTINEFYDKYPEIKIICSSRPSDYLFYNCHNLGFKYLEISPVDRKQIEAFLNTYFIDNEVKSKKLLKSLKDTGILEKLPKTPMTIALITILFDEKEIEIPATISDLYRQFIDLLIGKYTPENTLEIIEVGIKHRILCYIAKTLHSDKKQSISRENLISKLNDYAEEKGQTFDSNILLDDIIDNTGLLYINEKDSIQFKHLSFQEYLTAYEIFHHKLGEDNLFIKNFNNLWWQNVAIFYAGMSKDAPKLLDSIIENNKPTNFNEYITNTGGIGKILQALYNTDLSNRISAIEQSVGNIEKAIDFLINTDEVKYEKWKNYSKFGILQLLGGFFTYTHWSITLVEPLKKLFTKEFEKINENRSEEEQFKFEFKLFLICSILATDDFISFSEFRMLVEQSKSNDLNLFAVISTHTRKLNTHLTDKNKEDEDFIKAEKKVHRKIQSIGSIADKVNIPLNNNKSLKPIPRKINTSGSKFLPKKN